MLLLAMLLLAVPASTCAECVDGDAVTCVADEALPASVIAIVTPPARRIVASTGDDALPPSPALDQVFRPPRPAFA
jgi:hypothetical protein